MFDTKDLEEIRLALFDKRTSVRESTATLEQIAGQLESGENVYPFAPGVAGAAAARQMAADLRQ
ncbi:hypothetical protein QTQ03_02240 [Micromonospora sp. WMMA1363]|uniref:hypothetical protein n=1 Tax=Micromonospora sp. WMMA1363 TaxID=3053985 RepID=UPI00259C8E68|nr:hypothetical protein [Micromonospora sp. WMMA1363]MDM4718469.1 hypothetical protein [Micromonospora sp. WMMA1363]